VIIKPLFFRLVLIIIDYSAHKSAKNVTAFLTLVKFPPGFGAA